MNRLIGKIVITATLKIDTGLHIGNSNDFSAIGAIDNPIVRDTVTKQPYIPGSSLKGKLRYLLARSMSSGAILADISQESKLLKRLFGASVKDDIIISRLQFSDIYMLETSVAKISKVAHDSYLTEIKYENTISRMTSKATPRQIERVPRAAEFQFKLTYNIENFSELQEDLQKVYDSLDLLQEDYLGGSGSRGYGRVSFSNKANKIICYGNDKDKEEITKCLKNISHVMQF